MVAALGPRIGEKHENRPKTRVRRQSREEIKRLGVKKMQVGPRGAVPLADSPRDTLGAHVKAEAKLIWMRRSVGGEKMPVAAADFADEARRRRQHAGERSAQVGAALGDQCEMRRAGGGGFHGEYSQRKDASGAKRERGLENFPPAPPKYPGTFSKSPRRMARTPQKRVPCPAGHGKSSQAGARVGRLKKKAVPLPISLSTQTRPPWSCTMCLTMLRPRPVPPFSRERPLSTR
jgi:hypothetical protein